MKNFSPCFMPEASQRSVDQGVPNCTTNLRYSTREVLNMLIFLLTTLATLSIHTACAYSSNGLYGRGDRDTLEEVIDSLTRPSHRDQEDSIDLDDFLTLLGRPKTPLEEDIEELRALINLLNRPTEHEAQLNAILQSVESRRPDPTRLRMEDFVMPAPRAAHLPDVPAAAAAAVVASAADDQTARKRSCKVKLGGHCSTQQMEKAVQQYNYLQSHLSPGRKRRSLRSILTNQRSSDQ